MRSIKLKWLRPEEPNGKITDYKIYYVKNIEQNLLRKETCNMRYVEGTKTSRELENLTENQTYYFKVCAMTRKGEGNCTNVVNASTSKGKDMRGRKQVVIRNSNWLETCFVKMKNMCRSFDRFSI